MIKVYFIKFVNFNLLNIEKKFLLRILNYVWDEFLGIEEFLKYRM